MIRSNLINFLNRNWVIQLVLCFLPILFIVLYLFAYMYDISNYMYFFEYNNRITMQDMNSGSIKEVSLFNKNDDGTYQVLIEGSNSVEEDIALGDTIYSVYIINDSWFSIVTKSGQKLYQVECDLFGVEKVDNGYTIIVGDKSFNVNSNDRVCDIKLAEDGDYKIEFKDDSIPAKKVDFLSSLQVLLKNEDVYRIKISSAYEKELDVELNFCTNLPTNNVYYNESTQSFIKNIPEDFSESLILNSNILVVLFSMTVYCFLLYYVKKKDELILLKHKEILYADICSVVVLILCILFTLMLF